MRACFTAAIYPVNISHIEKKLVNNRVKIRY